VPVYGEPIAALCRRFDRAIAAAKLHRPNSGGR
jgi:hypothetical protein